MGQRGRKRQHQEQQHQQAEALEMGKMSLKKYKTCNLPPKLGGMNGFVVFTYLLIAVAILSLRSHNDYNLLSNCY